MIWTTKTSMLTPPGFVLWDQPNTARHTQSLFFWRELKEKHWVEVTVSVLVHTGKGCTAQPQMNKHHSIVWRKSHISRLLFQAPAPGCGWSELTPQILCSVRGNSSVRLCAWLPLPGSRGLPLTHFLYGWSLVEQWDILGLLLDLSHGGPAAQAVRCLVPNITLFPI